MPQLNEQQKAAVEIRGTNALVSAAAGSGKTFVLTERVAGLLMDPEHPVAADRLLISTFTRSAAAQMKARIRQKLEERSAADPRLAARQKTLLELAQIGTIDAFCLSLVREYGAEAGIPPTVSVSEASRAEQLDAAAVAEVLERCYAQGRPDFLRLAGMYFSGAGRDGLAEDLLSCIRWCETLPDPQRWLRAAADAYAPTDAAREVWRTRTLNYAEKGLLHARGRLNAMRRTAQESGNTAWMQKIDVYDTQLAALETAVGEGFSTLRCAFSEFRMANAAERKTPEGAFLAQIKTDISDSLKELAKLVCIPEETAEAQRAELYARCSLFAETALECLQAATLRRKAAGVYGFSDICRAAYTLLVRTEEDGSRHPTALATELSRQYDQIMIDEFQDVNEIQFGIYEALSDGKNLYMVGDVKQSIYRFRGSRPEIFERIAREYAQNPEQGRLLRLNYNYRSHPAILAAANFVFGLLMHESAAEIEYDGGQRLCCGSPEQFGGNGGFSFELIARGEMSPEETEAAFIVSRIREIMQGEIVDGGVRRKARLSDFCVMARTNGVLVELQKQLEARGISCSFLKSGNLFDTVEVAALLALLRAVNHPSDDVAMLAALMSPVWGFTPDDAAVISVGREQQSVYARVLEGRGDTAHPVTAAKCIRMAEELSRLQSCAVMMNVAELIGAALTITDFSASAAAFGTGDRQSATRCRENLEALVEYAQSLEQSGTTGLSEFLEAVESAIARDHCPQSRPVRAEDAVTLMTVHGSKGLEFPVCFLAGCHNEIFRKGRREGKWKADASGFALRLQTADGNGVYAPWYWELIERQSAGKERAEELRLLYVALTRAKYQMIVSCVKEDCETYVCKVAAQTGGGVFDTAALGGKSYGDWITAAALCHPDGAELRALTGIEIPVLTDDFPWEIRLAHEFEQTTRRCESDRPDADQSLLTALDQRLGYVYEGEELCFAPRKYTVTQLVEKGGSELEKPAFIEHRRGTEYGTMLHDFLQLCDFSRASEGVRALAADLYAQGKLSSEALAALNFDAVDRFFRSTVFSELMQAKTIYKEYNFLCEIPIGDINPGISGKTAATKVLLQGCADCIGVFEDRLLLIDYKSDRVRTPQELAERYAGQLVLYARSLTGQFGLPVERRVLYSFALGEEIAV